MRRLSIELYNTTVDIEHFCKSEVDLDCCAGTIIQLHHIRENRVWNTEVPEDERNALLSIESNSFL